MNDQTKFLSEQNASIFHSRLQSLMKHISSLGSIPICVTQPHRYVMTKKDGKTYGIPNVWGKGFSGLDYDYSLQKLNDVIFVSNVSILYLLLLKLTIKLFNKIFSFNFSSISKHNSVVL